MAIDMAFPGALRYLEGEDLSLFLTLGQLRSFPAGETLYARGERPDALVIVEEGEVEVVRPDGDRYYLGPGDVIGAAALAGIAAGEETVRAASDVAALVLSLETVGELARDHAGPAGRLCLGLVAQLLRAGSSGRRVAAAAGPSPSSTAPEATERAPSTGEARAREGASPEADAGMAAALEAARGARQTLEALHAPKPAEENKWIAASLARVAPALDRLAAAAGTAASAGTASGVLEAVRGELRPLLATSRLTERMNEREPGEPARYRSLDHIYRSLPEGDEPAGLALDAYLLARPFARALRERRGVMAQLLEEEVRRRARPGEEVRLLSLGCGPARALADLLDHPGMSELLSLTCVDDDQEAIVFANNLLRGRAPRTDLTLHQARPSDFSRLEGEGRRFDVVASLFVADNLETGELAETIRRAGERLNPGGVVLMAAFSEAEPDRWVTALLLNWEPVRHRAEALREALRGAPFAAEPTVTPSPSGLNLILRAENV